MWIKYNMMRRLLILSAIMMIMANDCDKLGVVGQQNNNNGVFITDLYDDDDIRYHHDNQSTSISRHRGIRAQHPSNNNRRQSTDNNDGDSPMNSYNINHNHNDGTSISSSSSHRKLQYSNLEQTLLLHQQQQQQQNLNQQSTYYHVQEQQSPPIINNNSNRTAIVHIGPHKTSTSAIQDVMRNKYHILRDYDHYDIPLTDDQRVAMGYIRDCFSTDEYSKKNCNMQQVQKVITISQSHFNLLLSAETFSFHTTDVAKFANFIQQHYDTIIIVVYYRRFYDWLYSQWNQLNKILPVQQRYPFTKWMSSIEKIQQKYSENHYTYAIVPRWSQYFTNVKVYNIHDQYHHNVLEMFYCQAMPDAFYTCQLVQEEAKTQSSSSAERVINKSKPLIYDELAYHAIKLGYIHNKTLLQSLSSSSESSIISSISDKIRYQQEEKWKLKEYDFMIQSKICFDQERIDYLLNKTLEAEQILFPTFYHSEHGYAKIIEHYPKFVKTKLCHIDPRIVLQYDIQWQLFFANL